MRVRLDLRAKMALLLIAVTLFTNVVTAVILYRELSAQLAQRSVIEVEAEVERQSWELGHLASQLEADAEFLAQTPPISGIRRTTSNRGLDPYDGSTAEDWRERLEAIFVGMLHSRGDYEQVRLIGVADDGRELVRVDRYGTNDSIRSVHGADLQRKGSRPYFADAVSSRSTAVRFSDIELNQEHGRVVDPHRPVLRVTRPVAGPDGEIWGVLVINTSVGRLLTPPTPRDGSAWARYVVDGHGRFLAHPDPGRAFEWESGAAREARTELPSLDPVFTGHATAVTRVDDDGTVFCARSSSFGPAESPRRFIVAMRSTTDGHHRIAHDTLRQALVLMLGMTLVALAIGLVLAHRIHAPLESIARKVAAIEIDSPPAPLAVPASPESRAIAVAFNDTHARLHGALVQLRRSNAELEELTYIASHDLQEPARTVNSFTKLLRERLVDPDDDVRPCLDFLEASSERMLTLVQDVLEHSRLGRLSESAAVDLDRVVEHVLEDLGPPLRRSGAIVSVDPLPVVRGQATELRMLFQNLLANAIKFRRPDDVPRIEIRVAQASDAYDISVVDHGIGFPREAPDRMFRMFQRGDADTEHVGSGIGLAHCKKVVELHGGQIWIEQSDHETKVVFRLPRASPQYPRIDPIAPRQDPP